MWYSIILTIGLLLGSTATFFLWKSSQFIKTGYKTNAIVIELVKYRSKNSWMYKPVFKYTTITNKEIIKTYNVSSNTPMWNEGETLEIIYNPNDPTTMKPTTYFGLYGICVILFAIALPFIVIGGGYFIFTTYFY